MRPIIHTETKPWWYVSALEGVRKQTDENSEALQRMDGTLHSLQKKLKEAVCNMNQRCESLESSCGELSAKLDACMTMRGELRAISGQLQSVKQARESESDAMDRRIANLERNHQQDKASTDDFRARLSYEVAQEVGELREALELESATVSASLRNLILDVDFAAQRITELQGEAGETSSQGQKMASAHTLPGVSWMIQEEPHLEPRVPLKAAAVQSDLAQSIENHLRCLRGVLQSSDATLQEAPTNLVDEVSARVTKILEAQANQTEERLLARLGIHSAAADWTERPSGDLKDEQDTTAPSRQQQQARGQPAAGGSPVATAASVAALGVDEELPQPPQQSLPAATAALQRRYSLPKHVSLSVSQGNNGSVPQLQAAGAPEVAPARGLSQPVQAVRRPGHLRPTRHSSTGQSLAAPVLVGRVTPSRPMASSFAAPAGQRNSP